MEIRLLRYPKRRIQRNGTHKSYRQAPPGAPVGHRLRRDLLLEEQRSVRLPEDEASPKSRLLQRRDVPLHINLPPFILRLAGNVPLLRRVHRPIHGRRFPHIPLGDNHHILLARPVGDKMGLLKIVAGVDISFTLTSKPAADEGDEYAELYVGRKGKVPTVVFVWLGLVSIVVSLLWVYVSPPMGKKEYMNF
ncbi:hypothetical protein HPP92_016084 [Vanilla planifolia]|uniref:Uncharacterized protein n=1 Tax=Vanilla planifolia TaxID=51239 RepID=A0A835QSU6_VANPL|nr:hypothetical protein HPP92_016084 [Vanilla planifolia]